MLIRRKEKAALPFKKELPIQTLFARTRRKKPYPIPAFLSHG